MIKSVWFDIGGTVHTQQGNAEQDVRYAEEVHGFLHDHGIQIIENPMELLEHINAGAKAYKAYSEETLSELPTDEIWRRFILRDFNLSSSELLDLGEPLSYMYDRRRKVITPRDGLAETLAVLADEGYRLGIISNIMSETFVPRILDEYGVKHYFEHIIMSSECRIRKPARGIFDQALEKMGVTAGESAYVGDTVSRDVRGVQNAGWRLMIQIDNPLVYKKDAPYLECGAKADYHIQSLREIPTVLKKYHFEADRGERTS